MKAHGSVWLVILSVAATTLVLFSAISYVPAVIGALSPSIAQAEAVPPATATSTGAKAIPTLHTLSIPPAAFSETVPNQSYNSSAGSYLLGIGEFSAPVYLPQGATVVKVAAYYWVGLPSFPVTVALNRAKQDFYLPEQMADLPTSTANVLQVVKAADSTIVKPTINNDLYSYYVTANLGGPGTQLYTVKIVYSY